jgi:transcriptional regulator with GAF, ATPase, and Fis domain
VNAPSTDRAPPRRNRCATRVERYLFVILEGARLDAGGMRVALAGVESLRIGRGQARALIDADGPAPALTIPDARMSGSHARIARNGSESILTDCGSMNGTRVNGEPIVTHVLRDGDIVEVGQTLLLYREIEEDAAVRSRSLDSQAMAGLEPGFATLDPNLERQLERLARVAPSRLSILLLGETGTGKEVLARALHALSHRPGPFVAVNCGAIPQNLVESQLFGHVRGAFSGALRDEPGLVRSAQGGTLLLDEIGDLPAISQVALLRVLQEGEVQPVGSTHTLKIDVRIIAATHMPLEDLIERGAFRRDLFARLAGYTFALAPLRERLVDLGLLIAALRASGKLDQRPELRIQNDAARALVRYDWPMNVRELEQCLHAACVLAKEGEIIAEDLPLNLGAVPGVAARSLDPPCADAAPGATVSTAGIDRRTQLVGLLVEHEGNLSAVARALRTSRSQIHRLMVRYGITDKP